MKLSGIPGLFARAWKYWLDDAASRLAAALTFYLMLSIIPLILFALGTSSLLLREHGGPNELQLHFLQAIRHSIGKPEEQFVRKVINQAPSRGTDYLETIISLVVALFGASGLSQQLRASADAIWKTTEASGLKALIWRKLVALFTIVIFSAVIAAWLGLDAVLGEIRRSLSPAIFPFAQILSFALSFAFWIPVNAAIFRYLPQKKVPWKDVWLAAVATSLAYALMKTALSLYLSYSNFGAQWGSTADAVVILLWAYYSAQIFFFGIELSKAKAEASATGTS